MPVDLKQHKLTTSFAQKIPFAQRYHRHLMPLYPLALEQFDLRDYDIVISAESGPAKGVLTGTQTCHICFCHSPMRYLWDMYHQYRGETGLSGIEQLIFSLSAHYVRQWDLGSAQRVDYFIAISNYVASRIAKFYGRESTVIHPPLKVDGYITDKIDDYYLVVSRLVEYKRIDLAVEACGRLGRRLHVVGDGEQYKHLKKLAGPSVKFLGFLSDQELREQFAHCRALIFPGQEDLGATPAEAQSFGRPVIGFGRGGILDVVQGYRSGQRFRRDHAGVFFDQPSVESLCEALLTFESVEGEFSPQFVQAGIQSFCEERFQEQMYDFVLTRYREFQISQAGSRFSRREPRADAVMSVPAARNVYAEAALKRSRQC
jgi:glycosyltransferase involved in cell wall biosynthesis